MWGGECWRRRRVKRGRALVNRDSLGRARLGPLGFDPWRTLRSDQRPPVTWAFITAVWRKASIFEVLIFTGSPVWELRPMPCSRSRSRPELLEEIGHNAERLLKDAGQIDVELDLLERLPTAQILGVKMLVED